MEYILSRSYLTLSSLTLTIGAYGELELGEISQCSSRLTASDQ